MADHDFYPAWKSDGTRRMFSSLSKCSLKAPSRMWWEHSQPSRSASCQIHSTTGVELSSHIGSNPWSLTHCYLDVQIPAHHRAANSGEYLASFSVVTLYLTLAITFREDVVRSYHLYLSCGDNHSHLKVL